MENRSESNQWRPPWLGRDLMWASILVVAVFLAYQTVWHAGFIWDDDKHLTTNPCIVGPLGLKEIWTTSNARICPLVLTTFWFEHALWGLNPLPYHLFNVFMHAAGAIMLWRVLLSLRISGAWLGAALWALHPVQVETVAWITELKNTQSTLFYLLAILFYVKWLRRPEPSAGRDWSYGLTLLFAAMAMASKSSTVILPLVFILCAWWVQRRWQWKQFTRIAPVFAMSIVASLVSIWTQNLEGANDVPVVRTLPERLITAGDVIWFYLGKLLWPEPLIFIYPRWVIHAGDMAAYLPLMAVIVVLATLRFLRGTWARGGFFALAYFIVALLPVLGLVDHYFLRYSFVGDHFQYLASMGPLALAGAGLARLGESVLPESPRLRLGLSMALLLVLAVVSWKRAHVYKNDETLWMDTLAKNPRCEMAHNNLGLVFQRSGRPDEAIEEFLETLKLNSRNAHALINLGNALMQKGQPNAAMAEYQKALEIDPTDFKARNNLGNIFLEKGKYPEAIDQYQKALELKPNYAEAHNNLGYSLAQQGRFDEAIAHYKEALKFNFNFAQAHENFAEALVKEGRLGEASTEFQEVLRLDPKNAKALAGLGKIKESERQMPATK